MVGPWFDHLGYIHIGIVYNYFTKGQELPWVFFIDSADMAQLWFDLLGYIHIGIVILSYEYHRGMLKNYFKQDQELV